MHKINLFIFSLVVLYSTHACSFNYWCGWVTYKLWVSHCLFLSHPLLSFLLFAEKTPPYIPYPLRLYESSHCVVELSLSRKSDIINPGDPVVNYMTVLHWYGTDGSHHKVDLRKLIRKKYKQVQYMCILDVNVKTNGNNMHKLKLLDIVALLCHG